MADSITVHVCGPDGGRSVAVRVPSNAALAAVLESACAKLGIPPARDLGLAHGRAVLQRLATTPVRLAGLPPGAHLRIVAGLRVPVGDVSVAVVDASTGRRSAVVSLSRETSLAGALAIAGISLYEESPAGIKTPCVQISGANLGVHGVDALRATKIGAVAGDASSLVLRVTMRPEALSGEALADLRAFALGISTGGNSIEPSDAQSAPKSADNEAVSNIATTGTATGTGGAVVPTPQTDAAPHLERDATAGQSEHFSEDTRLDSCDAVPREATAHAIGSTTRFGGAQDDDDYEPTAAHIAAAHAEAVARTRALADAPLVSRGAAQRRARADLLSRHPRTRLRFRIPRGGGAGEFVVEATFLSVERARDVHAFVAGRVVRGAAPFGLRAGVPSRGIASDDAQLVDLGLVPSAVVYVDCASPIDVSHLIVGDGDASAPGAVDKSARAVRPGDQGKAQGEGKAAGKKPSWLRL